MSRCDKPNLQEVLLPFLEGELQPILLREVAEHLRSCVACQSEVTELQHALKLVLNDRFQALENPLREDRSLVIPQWFYGALKQVFGKRSLIDSILKLFLFSRPTLALVTHATLGLLLLMGGYYYNGLESFQPMYQTHYVTLKIPQNAQPSIPATPVAPMRRVRIPPPASPVKDESMPSTKKSVAYLSQFKKAYRVENEGKMAKVAEGENAKTLTESDGIYGVPKPAPVGGALTRDNLAASLYSTDKSLYAPSVAPQNEIVRVANKSVFPQSELEKEAAKESNWSMSAPKSTSTVFARGALKESKSRTHGASTMTRHVAVQTELPAPQSHLGYILLFASIPFWGLAGLALYRIIANFAK